MTDRILVTGSNGMLGGALVRRLAANGHKVRGLDLRATPGSHEMEECFVGDVRDESLMAKAVAGADAVVHCAAALPSYPDEQIRSVIVGGTRNVLEAAYRANVPRVVQISSTAVYGLPKLVPTPESHPRSPVDVYSGAKASAEEVGEEFRDRGQCLSILRPKTFLGPGRLGLFAMLFEWADEGRNFPVLGRGDVRIQMLDIEDLVDAVVLALRGPEHRVSGTFNIGAERFGTIREDFQAVLDAAGHGRRIVSLPAKPALTALRMLERARLSPVYGRLLHKLLADSYVSVDLAREQLGFRPQRSNQDAILRTFAWWREERDANQARGSGATSKDAWRQGALALTKAFF
ncbi:NAD-dependent epimerase/dehydratase family protein [Actinoallomurus sp. CA-150999]|uniref:NAD-dependent epimerase/dehydratase family protein n=1 Tax=Actinoallomurus sp. CA-150999 TaxID=3239887 RepID=UPI003D8F9F02